MRLNVPRCADFEELVRFPVILREVVSNAHRVDLDFSSVQFVTPAWLAIVGGALRRLKKERPDAHRRVIGFRQLTYAAHMGFFRYFGVDFGSQPAEAPGSDAYIPLSEVLTADVRAHAAQSKIPVGQAVHTEAERLAAVLAREDHGDIHETLSYAIREIVRNVIEHSGAESYTFAAQFWPARGEVELVVADQGCGLAASLRQNPNLTIADDGEALQLAILPGVSSTAWRRTRRTDDWANSGYGLFMTQRLCSLGGSFELMSGDKLLRISPEGKRLVPTDWPGTVIVLRLMVKQLPKLTVALAGFRKEGWRLEREIAGATRRGPSRASQSSKW